MASQPFAAPNGAGARLVAVTELLENILENLSPYDLRDMQTLLLSQRTCRAFHQTILGSPTLQRNLGFERPLPSHSQRPLLSRIPHPNPFIFSSLNKPFKLGVGRTMSIRWRYYGVHAELRPDLKVSFRSYENRFARSSAPDPEHPVQSWRRMHFFAYEGRFTIIRAEGFRAEQDVRFLKGEWKNPTLGELFDLLFSADVPNRNQRRQRG